MAFGIPNIKDEILTEMQPFLERLDKIVEVLERVEGKLDRERGGTELL